MPMKRAAELIPLMSFFAETLRETLDEWEVSQAEVSRMTGIPSPHLTDMEKEPPTLHAGIRSAPEPLPWDLTRFLATSPMGELIMTLLLSEKKDFSGRLAVSEAGKEEAEKSLNNELYRWSFGSGCSTKHG